MDAFIETSRRQVFTLWRERHTINGLGVLGESVNADPCFHVPRRMVETSDALASIKFILGLLVEGQVGLHLRAKISLL